MIAKRISSENQRAHKRRADKGLAFSLTFSALLFFLMLINYRCLFLQNEVNNMAFVGARSARTKDNRCPLSETEWIPTKAYSVVSIDGIIAEVGPRGQISTAASPRSTVDESEKNKHSNVYENANESITYCSQGSTIGPLQTRDLGGGGGG